MKKRARCAATIALALAGAGAIANDYREGLFHHQISDFDKARAAWESCAVEEDYRCQYALGVLYNQGQGVPRDAARALHWFELAARQGSTDAQLELGVLRALGGGGLEQDVVEALAWFTLAARSGDPAAIERRDLTRSLLLDEEIEEAERRVKALQLRPSTLSD